MNRKELKSAAREAVAGSGGETKKVTLIFLIGAVLCQVLKVLVAELLSNAGGEGLALSQSLSSGARNYVISYGSSLVLQAVFVLLIAGYTATALELRQKNPVGLGTLLAGFRMVWRVLLLYVLMMLFISLWTYAFSLPLSSVLVMLLDPEDPMADFDKVMLVIAIYVAIAMFLLSYRYRMAFFVLMDQPGLPPRQALRLASQINRGYRMQLFLLDLSFVPQILLCILTCGVLLVWKLPEIITTYALAYDQLLRQYARRQQQFQEMHQRVLNQNNPQ